MGPGSPNLFGFRAGLSNAGQGQASIVRSSKYGRARQSADSPWYPTLDGSRFGDGNELFSSSKELRKNGTQQKSMLKELKWSGS